MRPPRDGRCDETYDPLRRENPLTQRDHPMDASRNDLPDEAARIVLMWQMARIRGELVFGP